MHVKAESENGKTLTLHKIVRNILFISFYSGELLYLNEATFLDNLKTRYFKDKIYVSTRIRLRARLHLRVSSTYVRTVTHSLSQFSCAVCARCAH